MQCDAVAGPADHIRFQTSRPNTPAMAAPHCGRSDTCLVHDFRNHYLRSGEYGTSEIDRAVRRVLIGVVCCESYSMIRRGIWVRRFSVYRCGSNPATDQRQSDDNWDRCDPASPQLRRCAQCLNSSLGCLTQPLPNTIRRVRYTCGHQAHREEVDMPALTNSNASPLNAESA